MPNLNVALNAGMTAYVANEAAAQVLPDVVALLSRLGETIALPEKDFSTFVALAAARLLLFTCSSMRSVAQA